MAERTLERIVCGIVCCLVLSGLPVDTAFGEVRMQTYTYKRVGDLEIKANVYRADDKQVRPVVVWIHGGDPDKIEQAYQKAFQFVHKRMVRR
ncbi:MAG: hypothetical protein U9Q07_10015 [Planctomycetota bacterium]|nr:hypothetical protein [Planctomycetota bacterium]